MMRESRSLPVLGLLAAALLLEGCASAQLAAHAAKGVGNYAGANTKPKGLYKIGEPYNINGVWYYPKVDYDYDETGIASWYGEQFHAKLTANGELFDMNEVTAAHKTLPLPSLVRVTNLENGRSMVMRVNDRGPFVAGRIIDLSRRSAQLLGMDRSGTARVRVQVLADESRAIAEAMTNGRPEPVLVAQAQTTMTDAVQARPDLPNASPRSSVAVQALPAPGAQTPASPPPAPVLALPAGVVAESAKVAAERQVAALAPVVNTITTVPVVPTEIYVQVGAFQNLNNAVRVSAQLQQVGRVTVEPKTIRGQVLNRVRFGPFTSVEEADQTLARVIAAGYPDARVIVDQ
jgi:rare lipoprotein A